MTTDNNVPNRNGISRLQRGILETLSKNDRPVPASAILSDLTSNPTPSQRATLSKALVRLAERGLVDRWVTEIYRPGKGYLYSLRKG